MVSRSGLQNWADTLLLMQNQDNGFGSYKKSRGSSKLKNLSSADMFDKTMIEYPYPEFTNAVLTSLCLFNKNFPDYQRREILGAVSRATQYIYESQRDDGSWYGS